MHRTDIDEAPDALLPARPVQHAHGPHEVDVHDARGVAESLKAQPGKNIYVVGGPIYSTAGSQFTETELRGLHRDGSDVWMSLNVSLARDWQFRTKEWLQGKTFEVERGVITFDGKDPEKYAKSFAVNSVIVCGDS